MALTVRWYITPLAASIDPANTAPRPHAWVWTANPLRVITHRLPGGVYGLCRITGDDVALDGLIGAGAPANFYRLRLLLTWQFTPAATKTFITTTWPTVTMQNSDRNTEVIRQLGTLARPDWQGLTSWRQPEDDLNGLADE